jgi:hypothetical protein
MFEYNRAPSPSTSVTLANSLLQGIATIPGKTKGEPKTMKMFQSKLLLIAAGLLVAISPSLFAQSDAQGQPGQKSAGASTSITGCLTKDQAGNFVLIDDTTGTQTVVTGPSDLEKHAVNHTVTLNGTATTDSSGKQVFQATKLQHVSNTCKAKQ